MSIEARSVHSRCWRSCMTAARARSAHDESKYPDLQGEWLRVGGNSVGPEQAARPGTAAAADAGVSGDLRGEPRRSGGRRAGQQPALHLHSERHAAGHDRHTETDGVIVMPERPTSCSPINMLRRIYTDGRTWPEGSRAGLRRLFDRPMEGQDGDGRFDTARGRDPPLQGPAHLRQHAGFRCTRTIRPSSRSGSISTSPIPTSCATTSP